MSARRDSGGRQQGERPAHTPQAPGYTIRYSAKAQEHLRALPANQRRRALDGIFKHLRLEPSVQARNRKRMRPNPTAPWELRLGSLRVYYDVGTDSEPTVIVHAVGVKERNRLRIGGEIIDL